MEGLITFTAGLGSDIPRRRCFNVFVLDDLYEEDVESFTLILDIVSQERVYINPSAVEFNILDNDGKSIIIIIKTIA